MSVSNKSDNNITLHDNNNDQQLDNDNTINDSHIDNNDNDNDNDDNLEDDNNATNNNNNQQQQQYDDISQFDAEITNLLNKLYKSHKSIIEQREQLHNNVNTYKYNFSELKTMTEQFSKKLDKTLAQVEKIL